MRRAVAVAIFVTLSTLVPPPVACADIDGDTVNDGISIRAKQITNLREGRDLVTGVRLTQSYEYRTEVACSRQGNDPNGDPLLCGNVAGQCDPANPNLGPGPLTRVLRRELDGATGTPAGAFQVVGMTCF